MVKLIYGSKGSGKTGRIIDDANRMVENGAEAVVFLTDDIRYQYALNRDIRMFDVFDYDIRTQTGLLGFVKGILASNMDIRHVYIDGAHRMTKEKVEDMEFFYEGINFISQKYGVDLVLTVSIADLPPFLQGNEFIKEKA